MSQVPTLSTLKVLNEKTNRKVLICVDRVKHCGRLTETAMISFVLNLTRQCSLCGWHTLYSGLLEK